MNKKRNDITFRGRYLGVIVLSIVQYIVGIIHISFGLIMFLGNFSIASSSTTSTIYSLYTLVYGFLVFVFTYLFWKGKQSGWTGTIIVSLFVILADTLTVLGLLSILGIPKIAAIGEIPFSIIIITYLLQNHIRLKYKT